MSRDSWFDDKAEHPLIQEQVAKLASFTDALQDGVVTKQELADQERRLVAAMRTLEPLLDDAQHAAATKAMVELTAYNIMRLLHELHAERARVAFGA